MMKNEEINTALENIQYLAMDVNVNEIGSHICLGNMAGWISGWRNAMDKQINIIKEALKNG